MRRLLLSISVLVPMVGLALAPSDGGPVTILPVNINVAAGDQYDPHVNGDLAAYTDGNTIRYHSFSSGSDDQILAPAGVVDTLSDVSDGKIVFSRFDPAGLGSNPIMVFDTATPAIAPFEVNPVASPSRTSAAIGGNTVAFIDLGSTIGGELFASELGGATSPVTNDSRVDQRPAVSPFGDLIVFESCQSSPFNCDIHQAGRVSPGNWAVTNLTNNSDPESNPDTDGVVVVYDSTRAGEQDIYWQHVGGDAEQMLSLPGAQRNPSVSQGVIAFESVGLDGTADLYVYQISTSRLFQVTNTPGIDESLNDVFVLPSGTVRVVWASGPAGDRDVLGADFDLPGGGGTGGGAGGGAGGGSGGSGGAGGGGGTCVARHVTLTASITYHPNARLDGSATAAGLTFAVPATIPVTLGSADHGSLWLTFNSAGGQPVKCLYKGDDDDDGHGHHGVCQHGNKGGGSGASAPSDYNFHHCTAPSVKAGSVVKGDTFTLGISSADPHQAKTTASVTLDEICPGSVPPVVTPPVVVPPNPMHGHGQIGDDGHHEKVGCSTSGGTFTLAALMVALLAWAMPRRTPVRVRSRRPTRE